MTRQGIVGTLALVLLLVVAGAWARPQETRQPKEPKSFASVGMKIKLDFSKEILGDLATADFEKISKNAKAMQGLNSVEQFARGDSPNYKTHLRVFQLATNELAAAAKEENLDRATLAYTQMTINCVTCHKEIRR